MTYTMRRMPARFMAGAPESVQKAIVDIVEIKPAAPLDYDIVLREGSTPEECVGLDFDRYGAQGCHFFLKPHEMRAYRERNRRKRVAWRDLPAATQTAILRYLES
jgi:hypothetical protein